MDTFELTAFVIAAVALLGSPGPGIAALLAVGRAYGWRKSFGFFWGLQIGLASAAGLTILGIFTLVSAFPWALAAMSTAATTYLIYLAYKIASAPVGNARREMTQPPTPFAGGLLGVSNPKAYAAFASLFASFQIFGNNQNLDSLVKWSGVVAVMIVVDALWLLAGHKIGQMNLSVRLEQVMNYLLAGAIVLAAILALF